VIPHRGVFDFTTLTNSLVFQPGVPRGWVANLHSDLADHA
jgi:hypothetical protein